MNRRDLAYWIATGVFSAVLGFSSFAHTTHLEMMVESMGRLGYPVYFMTVLGIAKFLGVIALLSPGRPLLKEWAYAGFTFNLIGATASHAFSGDPIGDTIRPAIVLLIGAASYLLRPAARRLPQATVLAATPAAGQASGG